MRDQKCILPLEWANLWHSLLGTCPVLKEGRAHTQSSMPVASQIPPSHCTLQVLDEIFNCLHRAQLGSGAESALDPQLPQRTRIRVAPGTPGSTEMPGPAVLRPERTLIQDVFGLEVQVGGNHPLRFSGTQACTLLVLWHYSQTS